MSKKKLCIIIPMYNSEEFIGRTLDSVLTSNLPLSFYNKIVVDDGSTDNSVSIVRAYSEENSNIMLITQKNNGASAARNNGLNSSLADYVWFIDSDDMVEKNLSIIINNLNLYDDVDIFDYQYNWINTNGKHVGVGSSHPTVEHNRIIAGRDAIIQGYTPGSVCGLIINKEFLKAHNLFFKVGITHEDVEITYRMFSLAQKVVFFNDIIYNYYFRNESVTRPTSIEKKIKYYTDEVEIIKNFYELSQSFEESDKQLSNRIKKYADGALFGCVYQMFRNRKRWKRVGINAHIIMKLKEYHYYPLKVPFYSWKKWLMCKVLNCECIIN